ncbi:LysE/ArgO family amino acid transporter [Thermoflavimicrobium daqui]|jgi:L-lysine exporter family protein LysE/ArgO|uniref:Lysine transporter LysE n=1 Tax=Thermoflavimicrobium daqui TaxID=2137476 RepID=A0A364K8Z2_9BACL|nr:LysE/ArgO family amino acid transporter [Thermoflavimicrobium daqui]RAL26763.1 lysine transporter LysE [Thermoflavimicrobium daqui]
MNAFIHGFILAFGLILPLGVQNVFIFNQGLLQKRFRYALPAIITASLCDTLLVLLAVFGVSLAVLALGWLKNLLVGVGILFLLYMGWTTWTATVTTMKHTQDEKFTFKKQILFAASVSLLNPHAILDTIGVIGTSSINYIGADKIWFTASTIIVSWLWFFGLAFTGRFIGKADSTDRFVRWINKISALIIWGTAIYLLTMII